MNGVTGGESHRSQVCQAKTRQTLAGFQGTVALDSGVENLRARDAVCTTSDGFGDGGRFAKKLVGGFIDHAKIVVQFPGSV